MKKLLIIPFIALLLCGCTVRIGYDYYEYKDLEGNEGIAKDCWHNYGNLNCELKDGTYVKVQSYKGAYRD